MDAQGELVQAHLLFERHRYDEAAQTLVLALSLTPENADVHALLALCQCGLKQFTLAKHHAEKAIELEPGTAQHHYTLSRVLIPFFDWEWIEVFPRDGRRFSRRVISSLVSMQSQKAIEQAIRLQPDNSDYYAHLALLNLMFARHDEALAAARSGLECFPDHLGCLHYLSRTLLELDEPGKAEEAVRTLLAFDPNSPYGHAGMGDVALYRRQAKAAEQHFLEALRLNPLLPWPEQGVQIARSLETGRAFVRELATNPDRVFEDPYLAVRWLNIFAKILLGIVVAIAIAQVVSIQVSPGNTFIGSIVRWLMNH